MYFIYKKKNNNVKPNSCASKTLGWSSRVSFMDHMCIMYILHRSTELNTIELNRKLN